MNFFRFRLVHGFVLFVALFGLKIQLAWATETILQFSFLRTHISDQKKTKAKPKETSIVTKKEVVFGDGFFLVCEDYLERIYDFKNKQIHYLDRRAKTHEEISLFADPAFRLMEYQNRLTLQEQKKQMGTKNEDDLFALESIFGMENEKQKVGLNETVLGNDRVQFLEKGQVVSEVVFSKNNAVNLYDKFLIYDNSLHPQVRRRIVESRKVASVIKNQLREMNGMTQFTLTLDSIQTRPDEGFQIPKSYGFSKKRPGTIVHAEAVIHKIREVQASDKIPHPLTQEWFFTRAQKALENKNYLNAALFLFEYGLQTGDQAATVDAMQKVAPFQSQDQDLNRFLRSLGVSGESQAKRSILELQKIDRKKIQRGHIIDVIVADQKLVLGQRDEARKLFLQSLQVNPYLAGVYKNLGDMLFEEYDTAAAWLCWDFAKKLYPKHSMLQSVLDYENELSRKFPEFFITQ